MTTLQDWTEAASAELGIDQPADLGAILDLAREVAHRVDRPAAPATAFLIGVAVGGGQELRAVIDRLLVLADRWDARATAPDATAPDAAESAS